MLITCISRSGGKANRISVSPEQPMCAISICPSVASAIRRLRVSKASLTAVRKLLLSSIKIQLLRAFPSSLLLLRRAPPSRVLSPLVCINQLCIFAVSSCTFGTQCVYLGPADIDTSDRTYTWHILHFAYLLLELARLLQADRQWLAPEPGEFYLI